ncbi:MAG: hypothetical protein R3D01_01520 [Hyphomicrobiales bacterium]
MNPRSTVEFAPISTSFSIMTRPICGFEMPSTHGVPEAILTTGMNGHAVADQAVRHRCAWPDITTFADKDAVTDDCAGGNGRPGANFCLALHDGARSERDAFADVGGGISEPVFIP